MLVWILACRKFGKNTSGGLFLTWLLFAVCGLPELNWWILVLLDRSYYAAVIFAFSNLFLVDCKASMINGAKGKQC